MYPGLPRIMLFAVLALLLLAAGCSRPESSAAPVVWIVYGSEKGDLSYTDAAYRGILAAQAEMPVTVREFVPADVESLPATLNSTPAGERPGLIITVGFQYADLVQALARSHPEIRFLAVDAAGIGSETIQSYEIVSYGDSYLSGVLAASATKAGRVGVIAGMKNELLDTFIQGYTDGARAVNGSITIEPAYVYRDSVGGFMDPAEARRIAEGMYRNGTDVIFAAAGGSNTGVFDAAKAGTGRYVIGTDSDQSPFGPEVVLASAVKRVDRVVSAGIRRYTGGTFTGGNTAAGLREGATGIVFNPKFEGYNATVNAWEDQAETGEAEYLRSREYPVRE